MRKVEKIENLEPFTQLWTIREGRVIIVSYLGQHPQYSSTYSIILCEGETLAEFYTEELLGYYFYEGEEAALWATSILPALVDWHYNQLEEIFALTDLNARRNSFPSGSRNDSWKLRAQLTCIADGDSNYVDQLADELDCNSDEVMRTDAPLEWKLLLKHR